MRLLTDRPETTAAFLPAGATWMPCRPADWPAVDQALWRIFGGSAVCEYADAPPMTDSYPERRIFLIDRAPTSQFEALRTIWREGLTLPDGLVALALEGDGFVGQRQRGWTALRGNLHLTLHYHLDLPAASVEAALIMLPAVAAAESIRRMSEGRCAPLIKWVNDLVLPTGKVAGVLTATQIEGRQVSGVLFGIGVNIDQAPAIFPSPFVPAAATLGDADRALRGSLPGLCTTLIAALDEALRALREQGPDPLYQRYRAGSVCIGQTVGLWPVSCNDLQAPPPTQGRVLDILPDLSLVLEGYAEPVRNARLALLSPVDH